MNKNVRYTVIGTGHGGKAMAAHLALMGFEVTLYSIYGFVHRTQPPFDKLTK